MTDAPLPSRGSRLHSLFAVVDDALRGCHATDEMLARGEVPVPTWRLLGLGVLFGAIYGGCVATYGVHAGIGAAWTQVLAAAAKLPLVFLLTVVVVLPSLCVFGALLRLPIRVTALVRLLLLTLFVQLAVLASLGPVFAFFAASTRSYDFLLLLNVAIAVAGGWIGLQGLFRSVQVMLRGKDAARLAAGRRLFLFWSLLFALVGAQMAWLLGPFLTPEPVAGVGETSSFFDAVWSSLRRLGRG
jgi:hypothetical protein